MTRKTPRPLTEFDMMMLRSGLQTMDEKERWINAQIGGTLRCGLCRFVAAVFRSVGQMLTASGRRLDRAANWFLDNAAPRAA